MHQALYRKYRPAEFSDVCGEEHVTSVLEYETKMSRFSHAYLFCGPRGTGKTTCAKILSKAVNCEAPVDGNPCGKCPSCLAIDSGNCPDVLEMDAASNNGVDYIRDIRDEVNYTPTMLKKRVYIIDEVHMLTISAFNALLKTLEEPPEHVVFILATTELHKLPATIISRCQRFDFRRIKSDVIADRLMYIAGEEDIKLQRDAAMTLSKQSQGGMRDAISLLELVSSSGKEVTQELVLDTLGLTGIEILYKTAVAVSRGDVAGIFSIIKTVDNSARDISVYFADLVGFWRDMLVVKYLSEENAPGYLDLTEPEMRLLRDGARRFSSEALSYHFSLLDDAIREMARLPQTKRVTAEITLIRMSDATLSDTNSSLLSRIAELENKLSIIEMSATPVAHTAPIEVPAESASAPAQTAEATPIEKAPEVPMIPILDIGDIVERLMSQNPMCAGFLHDSECYVSEDGRTVLIKTTNELSRQMLSQESSIVALKSAFRLQKIIEATATFRIESGAVPKKADSLDELQDL